MNEKWCPTHRENQSLWQQIAHLKAWKPKGSKRRMLKNREHRILYPVKISGIKGEWALQKLHTCVACMFSVCTVAWVCVCACMWTCQHTCRSQMRILGSLKPEWGGQTTSPRNNLVSTTALRLQGVAFRSGFALGCWGFELSSSSLCFKLCYSLSHLLSPWKEQLQLTHLVEHMLYSLLKILGSNSPQHQGKKMPQNNLPRIE